MKYGQALLWCDMETTGLNKRTSEVLEVAVIVTDFDLQPITGYTEVVKMTQPGLEQLRANEFVRDMHLKSGLVKESRESQFTLQQVETQIVNLLQQETAFEPGEFVLAGSGVAQFDYQIIEQRMPTLCSWLTYYQLDTGNLRRSAKILSGGRDLVNPVAASYQDGVKAHRALDDVKAHLEEGRRYQEFFRQAASVA